MATTTTQADMEKVQTTNTMDSQIMTEKPVPKYDKVDYSGAHEKTDPKEIALVKKLDRWIMVSQAHQRISRVYSLADAVFSQPMLWSMYWLNYLDRNAIALARLNDLEEDLSLSSTRQ